jgi:hypothetical protein
VSAFGHRVVGNFRMELLVIATSTSHSQITDARPGRPVGSIPGGIGVARRLSPVRDGVDLTL